MELHSKKVQISILLLLSHATISHVDAFSLCCNPKEKNEPEIAPRPVTIIDNISRDGISRLPQAIQASSIRNSINVQRNTESNAAINNQNLNENNKLPTQLNIDESLNDVHIISKKASMGSSLRNLFDSSTDNIVLVDNNIQANASIEPSRPIEHVQSKIISAPKIKNNAPATTQPRNFYLFNTKKQPKMNTPANDKPAESSSLSPVANGIAQKNNHTTPSSPPPQSNNLSDVKQSEKISTPINPNLKRVQIPGHFPDAPPLFLVNQSKPTASKKPSPITTKNIDLKRYPGVFPDSPTPSMLEHGRSNSVRPESRNSDSIRVPGNFPDSPTSPIIERTTPTTSRPASRNSDSIRVPGNFPSSPTPSIMERKRSISPKAPSIASRNNDSIKVPGSFPDYE